MYDLPGSDSGREWVEITNTGKEPINITKYKFGEGTTNHTLTIVSGNSTLLPGASAIVVDDPAAFKKDWPAFSGTLFNSAFSLLNTGEKLSIKNASSSEEDIVSYISSVGAAGDGGSLHRTNLGDGFVAALPNPGVFPGEIKAVPVVEKPAPVVKSSPASTKSKTSKTKKTSSTQTASAAEVPYATFDPSSRTEEESTPMFVWILGLVAIITLGVAGAVYARIQSMEQIVSVTPLHKDEFKIIEE